jgi:hypothetical protein
MRLTAFQITLFCLLVPLSALSLDLGKYEEQCSSIGFKPKTTAFGDCVLELRSRDLGKAKSIGSINDSGDGTPEHATCQRYGFVSGTTEYAQCRMQIDLAKTQAMEQRRQYEEQQAAQQRARDRAKGEAALLLGLGMMSGQQPRQPFGVSNTLQPLPPINRTYNLPGGKFMTCNTLGLVTNCQ